MVVTATQQPATVSTGEIHSIHTTPEVTDCCLVLLLLGGGKSSIDSSLVHLCCFLEEDKRL